VIGGPMGLPSQRSIASKQRRRLVGKETRTIEDRMNTYFVLLDWHGCSRCCSCTARSSWSRPAEVTTPSRGGRTELAEF
jgi:hypothetical protein